MRQTLTAGTPPEREAVQVNYEALPGDMQRALAPLLWPQPLAVRETGSDIPADDPALHGEGAEGAQADETPPGDADAQPDDTPPDAGQPRYWSQVRLLTPEEWRARQAAQSQAGAPPTEPAPGSPEYQAADAEAKRIVAGQQVPAAGGSSGGVSPTEPPPGSPEREAADAKARRILAEQEKDQQRPAQPGVSSAPDIEPRELEPTPEPQPGSPTPDIAPRSPPRRASAAASATPAAGPLAGEALDALLAAIKSAGGRLASVAGAAAGTAAGSIALAIPMIVIPTNKQGDVYPIIEGNLRVRAPTGQRSVIVERRVDDGLLGTGIDAKWQAVPVDAQWASGLDGQRVIAIDPEGLQRALAPNEVDATRRITGIAMAEPPSNSSKPDDQRRPIGPGHNSESLREKLEPEQPEPSGEDPKPPLLLPAPETPGRVRSRINLQKGDRTAGWIHVLAEHFNPAKSGKSQFGISQSELRYLLQSREVAGSPVVGVLQSREGPRYVREVTLKGRIIGIDATTKSPTSTFTIMTDRFGNLVTTFPGRTR